MHAADIEKMLLNPTWKEMLMEMISSEKLDPWNIDINILANGFFDRVKKMKELELHVPANIILASAILLKYKSLILVPIVVPEVVEEVHEESYEQEALPSIELVSRIAPKRPITLEDLMSEMEKALSYEAREGPKPRRVEEVITLPAPDFDIEMEMEEVMSKVKGKVDSEGWTTFSAIVPKNDVDGIVHTLLPLLHLSQKKVVDLRQDEFFGEIFIKV
ncbi:segregation/condensation protein A [Candidatus Micrarchaeota archaeon]|nr:segregation/condensation protein A [Candidatus Micrarchaeota archaeon]